MRKPTPSLSLNDVPRELVNVDGGDLGPCPVAGLCCPDDPLDTVMSYVSMFDDGFLDDLGLNCCSPPGSSRSHQAHDNGSDSSLRVPQGGEKEADTGALAAPCEADVPGGPKSSACHVFDSVTEGLPPPLQAHSLAEWLPPPLQAHSLPFSPTSSARRSLSPTSGVAEPQELTPQADDDLRWTVLRKPRQQRASRRRRAWPSWPLTLPLPFVSAAAHDDDDSDDKDRDFEIMIYHDNVGGNGPPRPGAGRQRQRRQAGKHVKGKTCTHCRATDTPQWRAGPAGNSTLCNACGIRYKMGKLFPEYRPSNSPEFSSNEHSNRHRNVERIRQRKKLKVMAPEVFLTPDADDRQRKKLKVMAPVMKVMAPEMLLTPDAHDKLLLQVYKYDP